MPGRAPVDVGPKAIVTEETAEPRPDIGDLPAWFQHPDIQRTEWVNQVIGQVWPHLEVLLVRMLDDVENDPDINKKFNRFGITGIKFSAISLGCSPARVQGVKVHSVSRNRVILDIFLSYCGDSMFQVSLVGPSFPISASVSNITLEAGVRVQLSHIALVSV